MKAELPPQYDPKAVESAIYQKWLAARAFHAVPESGPRETWKKHPYSIVIPPPNVTGALHLGHAINGTIQDILTRYHRMKGDNTLWMPGIDHAGIATQAVVEKTIFEKEHKSRHDLGREELVRRIWEWKEQFGTRILSQLQSIGASCDWDRTRFTLDEVCARAVRETFFKMFKDGLIFRGKRLVNWDTHLQTAVADDEIYHETVKGEMTSIKYPVEGSSGEFLIVATTRPETMLGDTAVAVHPDDRRYMHLHGKYVIVPLSGRRIPVICDGKLVDPKFGTGVVKVTPAHDPNDYATGIRHNLEQINLLSPDGKMGARGAGEFMGKVYMYVGLKFATTARKQILADLEALGLIVDRKPHEHEIGHSDRSKTPIEPYLSDQWFVRMGDIGKEETEGRGDGENGAALADGTRVSGLAQAAMDAVTTGRVKITPERYAKGYLDWLSQKRDWCISRQLWWGHRIPVFNLALSSTWDPRWLGQLQELLAAIGMAEEFSFGQPEKDKAYGTNLLRVCSHSARGDAVLEYFGTFERGGSLTRRDAAPIKQKELGEHWQFLRDNREIFAELAKPLLSCEQDPDVLDTWFSSALWPLSTMGWPNSPITNSPITNYQLPITNAPEPGLLEYFYPTALLSTGRDILTLWVARMVMFGLYCHGDVPFRDVYIHTTIQDGEGRPMKKTLGNGLDPVEVVASHGADAMRFTLASMSTDTQDVRMPLIKDPKTGNNTSVKFDLGRNFANKIWNASRFILSNIDEKSEARSQKPEALEDRWILSRLNATIQSAGEHINSYHFAELAETLRTFFWTDLCDWYLEIAKARIKAGDAAVQSILLHCLRTSLKLLHPVMPFITEELWSHLPGEKSEDGSQKSELLVTAAWPTFDASAIDPAATEQMALIQSVTSAIREIQNRYPAAKGKPVTLMPRDAGTRELLEKSRGIIESLTGNTITENSPTAAKPENAGAAVLPETQIFIGGVIEKAAETAKLAKHRDEKLKQKAGTEAKLANEAFTSKAPPKIVQGLRDQLAKLNEELAAIEKNLAELG